MITGNDIRARGKLATKKRFVSRSWRFYLDTDGLIEIFKAARDIFGVNCAVVEKVHSMPNQGVASTFTFGYGYGIVFGALKALGLNVVDAEPQVWKGRMGVTFDKRTSIAKAAKLFGVDMPEAQAEAALIALWHQQNLQLSKADPLS